MEHVVVDDGSQDASPEILRSSSGHVTWIGQRNQGQSSAANRAFAASHGDFIGWLNSDDAYFGSTVIADVVDLFQRRPNVDVIYGHAAQVNDSDLVLYLMWAPPFSRWLLMRQSFIIQSTTFIRRSAMRGKFLDESFDYAMDRELWLRLDRTSKFQRLPKVLAVDRHHLNRKTLTMRTVGSAEETRLQQEYGCLPSQDVRVFKLWHIAVRFFGLGLIPPARRSPLAFPAAWDGTMKLVLRQIATTKVRMPTGV